MTGLLGTTALLGLTGCLGDAREEENLGQATSALSGSNVGWVDTIAPWSGNNLRTPGLESTYNIVVVKGYYVPGDGGGGEFFWDAASTETDDGGTIISNGASTGRWKRLAGCASSPVTGASALGLVFNVKWFGAKGDGVTTDNSAIQQAINACSAAGGGTVFLPPGKYVCDTAGGTGLVISGWNINIVGAGVGVSILTKQASSGNVFTISANVRYLRFANFGIRPKDDSTTLITSGACFNFTSGGMFNSIENIHTISMYDCIVASNPTSTQNNLRVQDVTCELHKRYGAWLIGAIDPVITNLWTFLTTHTQGACVVYDSYCDGLVLIGAIGLAGLYGIRTQNSVASGQGPRALNASKCIMDNAGSACWSLTALSYGHFDGCFAATQQTSALGVSIAADCADLRWTNVRIANCWGRGVQIDGAKSISFVGGSILGCNQGGGGYECVAIGTATAKAITFKGVEMGRDPAGYLGGVPVAAVKIYAGSYFQIDGNFFTGIASGVIGTPGGTNLITNNIMVPYP